MPGFKSLCEVDATHGGKAMGLRLLIEKGLRVPDGVAIDSNSVNNLLNGNQSLLTQLKSWLASTDGLLAVRSSAVNEDGTEHSFAGVYETALNVKPLLNTVLDNVRHVSMSARSNRAVAYSSSESHGMIPVVIQKLIEPTVAGVLFSKAIDPFGTECAYIEWVSGLGDALVSGKVTPAAIRIPWNSEAGNLTLEHIQITRAVPKPLFVDILVNLIEIVNHEESRFGWDVEWAIDREDRLWALQMRPTTIELLVPDSNKATGPLSASPGIAAGPIKFIDDNNYNELEDGQVLVAKITEADYISSMKRAAAIVTEEGGLLSHAAIVARELGKPCIVGAVGALSRLVNLQSAEVNATMGTIRQGDVVIGGDKASEIDWTSVYLYDRGFELVFSDVAAYIEPTMDGVIAYVDAGTTGEKQRQIAAHVRRSFHTPANVVEGDKRIWYREWCRFDQLRTVNFIASLFKTAIESWNVQELKQVIKTVKNVVLDIRRESPKSQFEQLFWKEVGAALHALVAVEVEGYGLWGSYRKSATWRTRHGVRFDDFLSDKQVAIMIEADPDMAAVRECMRLLGELRNEAYLFFSENDVFDDTYFGSREVLIQGVCIEGGMPFVDEDSSLTMIYRNESFRNLDRLFWRKIYSSLAL